MSDEAVPVEEPNITTNVEDVSDEESVVSSDEEVAKPEVADVAEEVAEPEPAVADVADVQEVAEEPEEVKSSDNDLEDRVKELEEKLNHLLNILPIWAKGCANFPVIPDDLINLL